MEPPRYCHLSLVSRSVSTGTGRCKVKKSVDILPQGAEGISPALRVLHCLSRFACLVGAEFVTVTLAVMCATLMAADAAAFPSSIPRLALRGLATRKGFG